MKKFLLAFACYSFFTVTVDNVHAYPPVCKARVQSLLRPVLNNTDSINENMVTVPVISANAINRVNIVL